MRFKLAVLAVYALGLVLPASLPERPAGPGADDPSEQAAAKLIRLDVKGKRGVVLFDHKAHESYVNPDPAWPYRATAGAACAGCHHTRNAFGVPQLWKCGACHRGEGNKINPTNRDFDEVFAQRAFHDSCIGCHRASAKGPATCNGCHASASSAR